MAHKRKQVQLGMYVSPEQAAKLKELSELTMIPQARLFRQALDGLFEKYADTLTPKPATPKPASKTRK